METQGEQRPVARLQRRRGMCQKHCRTSRVRSQCQLAYAGCRQISIVRFNRLNNPMDHSNILFFPTLSLRVSRICRPVFRMLCVHSEEGLCLESLDLRTGLSCNKKVATAEE